MLSRIKIAIAALLVMSFASAALARPSFVPINPSPTRRCVTDEGQGRFNPCNGGN